MRSRFRNRDQMTFSSKMPAPLCVTLIWYEPWKYFVCLESWPISQMLFWGHTAEKPPMDKVTIGHENTGFVTAIGSNVQGFKVGDVVGCLGCSYACCKLQFLGCSAFGQCSTIDLLNHLDECEGCRVHNLHCAKGTGRMHGFTTHGHFADYSLSDYRNAMVLPKGMDTVSTAPLFCAGVTGKEMGAFTS